MYAGYYVGITAPLTSEQYYNIRGQCKERHESLQRIAGKCQCRSRQNMVELDRALVVLFLGFRILALFMLRSKATKFY